jgi:hypothetical protein
MAETGDPVGTGLVASLPQPGGNVTGIAAVTAELAGKSIQLIRDMLPSARRVTALANATDPRFRDNKRSPATLMVASVWSLGEDPKPPPRVPCQPSNCEIRLDHSSTVGSSCMVRTHAAFHSALVLCVSRSPPCSRPATCLHRQARSGPTLVLPSSAGHQGSSAREFKYQPASPPRSARWNEEMDERSARRNRKTGCHYGSTSRSFR